MKREVAIIGIVLPLVFGTSCEQKGKTPAETKPPAINAKVEAVALSTVPDVYEAVGTVRSKMTSVLSSKIVGNIMKVHVREGDRVRIGQLLIEIDNEDAMAQMRKAQAGLQEGQKALEEAEEGMRAAESAREAADANKSLAEQTFKRYQVLQERRSVSEQEFDEVRAKKKAAEAEADRANRIVQSMRAKRGEISAKIDQAKAEVERAAVYVAYGRINSPLRGLVTAKQAEVGALAVPGAPLLTIENDSQYRFEAGIEESQIGKIRRGDSVRIHLDVLSPKQLDCRVNEVVPTLDPASRTFMVKIDLPQGIRPPLRSGLYGRALFSIGQRQSILIPQTAILQRGQLIGVYAVDPSSIVRLRLIKIGLSHGDRVEVLSGLNAGERIIVEDVASVMEGSRVTNVL
jgi:membrane fusion protein, multidrug efflux system